MTTNTSNNIKFTAADREEVSEWAFTGTVHDQAAYLETERQLRRFLRKFPTLKNVFSESNTAYNATPIHAKIFAVDVLRAAFVTEPAHSYTKAHSKSEDPRAILQDIHKLHNQTGVALAELQYRDALAIASAGHMELHESVTAWMIRMQEAHSLMDDLQAEAQQAPVNSTWHHQAESYLSLVRRRPTVKDTIILMLRPRTGNEPRALGADTDSPVWNPYPDWWPSDLLAMLRPLMTSVDPTFSDMLERYHTWMHLNPGAEPKAGPAIKKAETPPHDHTTNSKRHTHRADGQPVRCNHEAYRDSNKIYSADHRKAGQCKLIDTAEGCLSAKRLAARGKGTKRKGDGTTNTDGTNKRVKITTADGRTFTYTHCANFVSTNGQCAKNCPLRSVHYRNSKGERWNPTRTDKDTRKKHNGDKKGKNAAAQREIIEAVKRIRTAASGDSPNKVDDAVKNLIENDFSGLFDTNTDQQ